MLQSLAAAGAQVIVLTPEPLTPSVVQLLLLLRSATENERLYAEQCDLADVASIRTFVAGWQKEARSGMVQDLEARIDGLVFCDEDDVTELPGIGCRPAAPSADVAGAGASKYGMTRLTGRHALVQLLLPVLLRSAATSTSPLRIINTVSPFYATVTPATFRPKDLEYSANLKGVDAAPYLATQPWIAQGQIALASVLLWQEFHKRAKSTTTTTPAAAAAATAKAGEGASPLADVAAAAAAESTPVLALSACPGLLRSTIRSLLCASPSSPSFSVFGCAVYLFLFPLIWLFAKSADEGAQCVLAVLMADVYREGETLDQRKRRRDKAARGPDGKVDAAAAAAAKDDDRPPLLVRPGALYREGLEVRYGVLVLCG